MTTSPSERERLCLINYIKGYFQRRAKEKGLQTEFNPWNILKEEEPESFEEFKKEISTIQQRVCECNARQYILPKDNQRNFREINLCKGILDDKNPEEVKLFLLIYRMRNKLFHGAKALKSGCLQYSNQKLLKGANVIMKAFLEDKFTEGEISRLRQKLLLG